MALHARDMTEDRQKMDTRVWAGRYIALSRMLLPATDVLDYGRENKATMSSGNLAEVHERGDVLKGKVTITDNGGPL